MNRATTLAAGPSAASSIDGATRASGGLSDARARRVHGLRSRVLYTRRLGVGTGRAWVQWCSECGVEHEDRAVVCALCDAPLTSDAPPPPAPTDHSLGTMPIGPLSGDQLARMTLVLRSRQVPFELVDDELRFPESRRPDAEAAVAELHSGGSGESLAEAFDELDLVVDGPPGDVEVDVGGNGGAAPLGSTLRRVVAELVGTVIWGVILSLLGALTQLVGAPDVVGSVTGIAVTTLVNVTLVSRFGADPGKFAHWACGWSTPTTGGHAGARRCFGSSCCSGRTGCSGWQQEQCGTRTRRWARRSDGDHWCGRHSSSGRSSTTRSGRDGTTGSHAPGSSSIGRAVRSRRPSDRIRRLRCEAATI